MVKSFRGREVDMASIAKKNEKSMALGNMSVNARGDVVQKGKIVKSREEILKESKSTSITKTQVGTFKKEEPTEVDKDFKPVIKKATPTKIVEKKQPEEVLEKKQVEEVVENKKTEEKSLENNNEKVNND